jgi:predicted TIM-barrel fold metal-dependent hydrolase
MIIDGHAHAFPQLGSASGGQSGELHLDFIQHHVQYHVQGFRRLADGTPIEGSPLTPRGDGIADMPDVNLHAAECGRLEFTAGGEGYFLQWYPPTLRDMTAPPEMMIAQMDYLGVDKAVLQHDHVYGRLDDYLSQCAKQFPGRFLPLAQINEWSDDIATELDRLDRQIEELGLAGLYFCVEGLAMVDFAFHLDDARFEPLWERVRKLKVPIFWHVYTSQRDRYGTYLDQVRRLDRWAKAHPDIPCVYTHGIETIVLRPRHERFEIPREMIECLKNPNMHLELMLQLMAPDTEYPYEWARPIIKMLRDELGPEKLVWGSDMPAAERTCTYRQSMNYVKLYCDFLSDTDKALFFGGNLERIFGL